MSQSKCDDRKLSYAAALRRHLQTIALAIEVDAAMVIELDRARATHCIDDDAYIAAYRSAGRRSDRERQIVLIRSTGDALERLARKPLHYPDRNHARPGPSGRPRRPARFP